ncbi:MAG: thioredoxin reductase (NADPH) [Saprospiraceae bacterium]|jgi:thioredoxin reductase (NADPH)|tara:strand:+ start:1214 stop:2182 length:969 start_codon:yes stop_codon:yes gene_type:complete
MHDIIIIGGGPTGINCAIEAQKAGFDYVILEKGVLVNSIFNFPANMTFFSTSLKLEIGDTPFISHSDKPTRREALEYYRRLLEKFDLNIKFGAEVMGMSKSDGHYIVDAGEKTYESKYVIIATGFYDHPNMMDVPGEDLPKVKHYYDEVHHYIRKKVLVVGGANSACDVALECWQKGADVTMAVRGESLYKNVKYWILPNIENRIKEESIKAYFNTTIKEIKPKSVILKTPEGEIEIENDFVLAMTGYSPNYTLLSNLGIEIKEDKLKTPVFDEHSLETNLPGVFMAGVVGGGLKTNRYFIENTRHHAQQITREIELRESIA